MKSRVLPPLSDEKALEIRRRIAKFWTDFSHCDDLTGTLRGELREMEMKVTDLLSTGQVEDVYDAWQATVRAIYLLEDPLNL